MLSFQQDEEKTRWKSDSCPSAFSLNRLLCQMAWVLREVFVIIHHAGLSRWYMTSISFTWGSYGVVSFAFNYRNLAWSRCSHLPKYWFVCGAQLNQSAHSKHWLWVVKNRTKKGKIWKNCFHYHDNHSLRKFLWLSGQVWVGVRTSCGEQVDFAQPCPKRCHIFKCKDAVAWF